MEEIFKQISGNQFLSGGLVLGALTSVLYSLKSVPMWIWGRIRRAIYFSVTIEQTDDLYPWVQNYLNTHYKEQLRSVKAGYLRTENRSDEKKTHSELDKVVYNHYGDSFKIFFKRRLLIIHSIKDKMENASDARNLYFEKLEIGGVWAKGAIHNLIETIISFNKAQEIARKLPCVWVTQGDYYDGWSEDKDCRLRNLSSIFIPSHQKQEIVDDIKRFLDAKDFYYERGIPYRRGYLFDGPPGTGKSSLVSALAAHFKRDLYLLNLKSLTTDVAFSRFVRMMKPGGILLIEDIDRYYSLEKKDEPKINFSTFINELSGVRAKDDVIIVMTTNHSNVLDEALTRSGRIDSKFFIGNPSSKEVSEYLSWFYRTPIEIDKKPTFTIADVENACVRSPYNSKMALAALYGEV